MSKKPEYISQPKPELNIKDIRALGELAIDLGLQQLTLGELTLVISPMTLSQKALEHPVEVQNSTAIDENRDSDEDFFPEVAKMEQAELRRRAEEQDDPDLFWSSDT